MHRDTHEGRPSSLAHWSLREAVFLVLANNLPRLWLLDRLGLGAVVTRDVAAYTLVGGVPARVLRELPRSQGDGA